MKMIKHESQMLGPRPVRLPRRWRLLGVGVLTVTFLTGISLPVARASEAAVASAKPHSSAKLSCSAEAGQRSIEEGNYERAIREFTCLIQANPAGMEGYRGRIEAQLLLGRYSDALGDAAQITARVLPAHPDAVRNLHQEYAARLAESPEDIPALTGASFARWWNFDYVPALQLLNRLVELQSDSVYGRLFRGSCQLLRGAQGAGQIQGEEDIQRALTLAPASPDVHFIVADAYTYGLPDPMRAMAEAMLAWEGGLNTPRLQAILASAYEAFGDWANAAGHITEHIKMVTTQLLPAAPLLANMALQLDLIPGRTFGIPLPVSQGESVSVATSSRDFYDSILVLLAPDGTPVIGSDDENAYFAAIEWVAPMTGTYRLWVTSFEGINTGLLKVTRN
jgi:tetratricopeptide (TPR) repeat protein